MTKRKVIKNPNAPGGRSDWKGRTPRRRVSLTHQELRLIAEAFLILFSIDPDSLEKDSYQKVYGKILDHIEEIQKPLTKEVEDFPLLGLE